MRYTDLFEAFSPTQVEDQQVVDESQVDEAYGRGWAILPATVALYNKKVVDIVTAASEWADGDETILVCSKTENDGRARLLFIASSGDCFDQYQVGQGSETYHDQTGASKGYYKIENVVVLNGGQIIKKKNEIGLNKKCSLAVFK